MTDQATSSNNSSPSAAELEDRIRTHAYHIWCQEGCPDGRSEDHWHQARELVEIEDNQRQAAKPSETAAPEVAGNITEVNRKVA